MLWDTIIELRLLKYVENTYEKSHTYNHTGNFTYTTIFPTNYIQRVGIFGGTEGLSIHLSTYLTPAS